MGSLTYPRDRLLKDSSLPPLLWRGPRVRGMEIHEIPRTPRTWRCNTRGGMWQCRRKERVGGRDCFRFERSECWSEATAYRLSETFSSSLRTSQISHPYINNNLPPALCSSRQGHCPCNQVFLGESREEEGEGTIWARDSHRKGLQGKIRGTSEEDGHGKVRRRMVVRRKSIRA